MATAAFAQTTLFCSAEPFPEITLWKICAASSIVAPPFIVSNFIVLKLKSIGFIQGTIEGTSMNYCINK